MKQIVTSLCLLILLIPQLPAETNLVQKTVTIIPIKGMIEPALLYVVRRGYDNAVRNQADAIIFHMDTPGGAVKAAGEIISLIGKNDIPTYTYVDKGAYSAGAFIALAAGNIYMAPGSVIGAATPMMMSPMGGAQEMPEEVQEKMTSAVSAMVRAAAEQGGHDPKLGEAMVRADMEYKVGREVISESGRLLTLTNTEAEQLVGKTKKPLLSSGTVKDIEALLIQIGLPNAQQHIIEVTGAESIARTIAKVAPILMLIGMGGLWLEFKTPGFGIFGLLGGTCLLLFFFGHHIAGLSGMEDALFFMLGVLLIGIEIFITPGFGFVGLGGLLIMLASLINAMSERMPGSWQPISWELETFTTPLINVAIAFSGSLFLTVFAGKYLPKTRAFSTLTLHETIKKSADHSEELLGLEGTTLCELRPSGSALFEGQKRDVITQGEFIAKGTTVRIISLNGIACVVEPV
ncbi:MAG: NfeD family protein [Pontiellaceae bacterium]